MLPGRDGSQYSPPLIPPDTDDRDWIVCTHVLTNAPAIIDQHKPAIIETRLSARTEMPRYDFIRRTGRPERTPADGHPLRADPAGHVRPAHRKRVMPAVLVEEEDPGPRS